MGNNCCTAPPTTNNHIFSPSERENPITGNSPPSSGVPVASHVTGHATPDSMPEIIFPPEPQQLEHIADREG